MFAKTLIVLVLFCYLLSENVVATSKTNKTPIEHVIVLMLENRSFDHMLGFLKKTYPDITGCLPNENQCSNPLDPTVSGSPTYTVDDTAVYEQASPSHSIHGTTEQIYGVNSDEGEAKMNGFIKSYGKVGEITDGGVSVMKCFAPEHVPVISSLAEEFAVFDGWHASVPGPTMVNRAYAASATSHGMGTNDEKTIALGLPQTTMFKQLHDMGLDWRVYFELVPAVLMFKDMRRVELRDKYSPMRDFYTDVAAGNLPEYTWLEPSYYTVGKILADDQHPDHDVSLGEELIKNVYEAVRSSPIWNTTALIITYDEHGGFFDHVSPADNIPNPDGINSTDDPFDFTRLGIRIPTVVISPYISKGKIVHGYPNDQGQYEHSSLAATVVHKLFGPKIGHAAPDFLTARDAWAATFESVFTNKSVMREDCPKQLPKVFPVRERLNVTHPQIYNGSQKINDLQHELLALAAGVVSDHSIDLEKAWSWTEKEAGEYIAKKMNAFFGRNIVEY